MRVRLTAVAVYTLGAAALLAAARPPDVSAQTRQDAPAPARDTRAAREGGRDANADLSITARVTADSLRFEKVPNTRVEFTGRPERETVWDAERENLPPEVRPGVTYRDVGITLRITSVFADIDRIVAEALGEVPAPDEARPQPAPTSTPTPAPPSASPVTPAPSAAVPADTGAAASRRRPARGRRGN
jgi:hypothetical protein